MCRAALLATTTLVLLASFAHGEEFRQLNFLLFEAAQNGRTEEVVELLKQGASVEARDRFGNTALLLAARTSRVKMIRALIEAGPEIDQQNLAGSTALLRATTSGRTRTAKALLKARADA
ncbi:MAG: ankyrin repeat domain-containing protein [Kiloniellales bacterium]